MLGVRQWLHGAFCVSRQHRLRRRWPRRILMCLFIVCESKFTIGESRTISHANDTQAQQVAPNPRPGRFSTETPLERERRLQIQREQRRRRRQQETAGQKERRLELIFFGCLGFKIFVYNTLYGGLQTAAQDFLKRSLNSYMRLFKALFNL